MRSATRPLTIEAATGGVALTEGESSFRNAKLHALTRVAYKAAADVVAKGSILLVTIVAARRLSPWAFGVFGLGTTCGWLIGVAADFGVQMHLARVVAQSPRDASAQLARWWRFRVLTSAVGLGSLAIVLMLTRAGATLAIPVFVFACVYSATGLVDLLNYFYRGLGRTDIEADTTMWQRGATLVAAVVVLIWTPSVTALAVAILIPSLFVLLWSLARARRMALATSTIAPASPVPTDTFRRDVFPIGLGIVLSAVYFRIDVLFVQGWIGTEAVARYNAAFRIVDALRLVPAAVLAVVLPALCRAVDLKLLRAIAATLAAFGLATAAAGWVAARWIVPAVFGEEYASAAPVFRVLLLSFPLLCVNFALTHQLIAWNRERFYALNTAAALAVNIALNAWLIPVFALAGAAWATLGTEVWLTGSCVAALAFGRRATA